MMMVIKWITRVAGTSNLPIGLINLSTPWRSGIRTHGHFGEQRTCIRCS